MRFLILTAVLTVCSLCVPAQAGAGGSQFDAAAEAFESGEYEQTIDLLAAYEKSNGTSPRLESLRALAYRDLEMPKESYQAILVYLRLTAKRDLSGSEAHQDMLKLRDEMLEAIEKEFKEKKEKLDEEREEEAQQIVERLEAIYQSPEIRTSSSSALPATVKAKMERSSPGENAEPTEQRPRSTAFAADALAELEMWRKINQSTVAMDYFLFIETFPNGQFTEIARKKMHELGDPVWNEVRKSFDPFKFRDYIKNNPDGPFIDVANSRMKELAEIAIEWEQIRVGDLDSQKAFEARNIGHPLAAISKKSREDFTWRNIENVTNPAFFRDFLANFPDSPRVPAARAKLDAIAVATPNSNTSAAGKGPDQSKSATAAAGATDSVVPGNALIRFSNIKFEWTKGGFYWSEFEVVSRCNIKSRLFDDVTTYPTKDEFVFNLAELKDARSIKGTRAWLVKIEKENGQKFEVTRSTHTRNPRWSAVKDTWNYKAEEQNVAVFGDEATAIQLAEELRKMIAECKKP